MSAPDAARAEGASLQERIHSRELEAGEARHRRVRIVERIRDEYDIDIESLAEPSPAAADAPGEPIPESRGELDATVEELRRKLASMTTVNLEALAESEQLAERLAGLEAQLADVTGAKESIEQLIARIDEESRRLLAETFEVVRGHFRTTPRGPIWISPSVRHIGDAEPEPAAVWRDDRTGELFDEIEAGEKPVDGGSDGTED